MAYLHLDTTLQMDTPAFLKQNTPSLELDTEGLVGKMVAMGE